MTLKIEDIEWHDARLEKIELHPTDSALTLIFKHICSYHRSASGTMEVWSSRATVILKQVSYFNMNNTFSDTYLDGSLLDANGDEVTLLPMGEEKTVSKFEIILAGVGTQLNIEAKVARLESLTPLEKLEDIIEE